MMLSYIYADANENLHTFIKEASEGTGLVGMTSV